MYAGIVMKGGTMTERPILTPNEQQLYENLMRCAQDKARWISLAYFLVSKFGTDFKLVITDTKNIPIPTLDNPLEWEYNEETDTLTLEIKEVEEKRIITP